MHEDAPHLPPEAESRRLQAAAMRQEASRDVEREAADAARLIAARAALPQDAAVLAEQDAVDALTARRSLALQAADDLPEVRAGVQAHRAKVAAALDQLGVHLAPEAARDAVPSGAVRGAVQRLVSRHAALAATARSADQSLAAARRRRDEAAVALQARPEPPSPALLRRTIDAMRGEGPLDIELGRAQRAQLRQLVIRAGHENPFLVLQRAFYDSHTLFRDAKGSRCSTRSTWRRGEGWVDGAAVSGSSGRMAGSL